MPIKLDPRHNQGAFVFVSVSNRGSINPDDIIASIQEKEGLTIVIPQDVADRLHLTYDYVAAWISLDIQTELDAVGITAAFANALAVADISCNVIAGYYHDHLFVDQRDKTDAMEILTTLVI